MKQKLSGGEEQDVLTGWRHVLNHDRGRLVYAKRKARRRLRKELKAEATTMLADSLYE